MPRSDCNSKNDINDQTPLLPATVPCKGFLAELAISSLLRGGMGPGCWCLLVIAAAEPGSVPHHRQRLPEAAEGRRAVAHGAEIQLEEMMPVCWGDGGAGCMAGLSWRVPPVCSRLGTHPGSLQGCIFKSKQQQSSKN